MSRRQLEAELERLREELRRRRASIPAHTVRVHQIAAVEELEDRIADLQKRLRGDGANGAGQAARAASEGED